MRKALTALACLLFVPAMAAADQMLEVEHADVVRLQASASTVIIGNPAIADAVIHDRRTLIVTGRLFGRTNIIALDRQGRVIYSEDFVVGPSTSGQLVLQRGAARTTMTCTPHCVASPTVGDDSDAFDTATDQQSARIGLAAEATAITEDSQSPRSLEGGNE
ncbi:pilus assembly protein N-terminal domain-containing protein [Hyphobacterium sp.]|uniref:pilus assembly protein N-terminal domain-containing protein n=1 Tax=Hyphobacterium sp. TaxID=2004662 RepID=UPI0037488D51